MTTYTFVPSSSTVQVDWNSPSAWSGGVAPNAPDADVVIPESDVAGQPYVSVITLTAPDTTVHSLSIAANDLLLNGALMVGDALSLSAGAELAMASGSSLTAASVVNDGFDIQGAGQITCFGAFQNETRVIGEGLILSAGSLDNEGLLAAGPGGLAVVVSPGGFANLVGSTLTGGSYSAGGDSSGSAILELNVGGEATIDAASIAFGAGGDIDFWDSGQSAYVAIETTLQSVAAGGTLAFYQGAANSFGAVSVDGVLQVDGGTPSFTQLTIDPGGRASGEGSIVGPITDNGMILAGADGLGGALTLDGPVSGSGTLQIATAQVASGADGAPQYTGASLELGGACSSAVAFRDAHGTLILDDAAHFTGTIAPTGVGDEIVLKGVDGSAMTGWSYSGGRTGGTLEIDLSDGSHLDLSFLGDFTAQSFSVLAGAQGQAQAQGQGQAPAPPTGPPSLQITALDTAMPASDQLRDHFNGAGVSDLLIANTSGGIAVGEVSGGQVGYTPVGQLGSEWSFRGTGDFLGDGKSGFLIENTGGWVVVGETAGTRTTFSQVAALGHEWSFVGTGDFFGDGHGGGQDQFLIENAAGQLDLGTVVSGHASYTQIDHLGSDVKVLGAGAYLANGRAQFLAETSSGALEIGDVQGQKAVYTVVGQVGPEWKYVGSGDVLGDGKAQFLIENASGALVAAEVGTDGQAHYTTLTGLGPEWTIGGVGDYLGDGHDQLALRNSSGALVLGDWSAGQIHWTQLGALGSEWSFHG
jgi:hypothetical protein